MTEPRFSILRQGSKEPGGPYTEEEIVEMLNQNAISKVDWVFYEGAADWQRIGDAFEIEESFNFVNEGQDQVLVNEAFAEVNNLLKPNEEIYYIALQAQDELLSRTRQSIVLSSMHLYLLASKPVGYEIEAHLWKSVIDVDYSSSEMADLTTVTIAIAISLNKGRKVEMPYIPTVQAKRLVEISDEIRK